MDTCGFKKDAFYLNKAFFTDDPMIHLLPHWNWSMGETVRVMPYTNCEEAELFLNDKSLGKKSVDKYDMTDWIVPFESGTLKVVGFKKGLPVCEDSVTTSGKLTSLSIAPSSDFVLDGCDDAVAFNIAGIDKNGFTVPNADNLINFSCEGGVIIGVGNGDPNSHEADKSESRRLFNGLCQVIVRQTDRADSVTLTAASDGINPVNFSVPVKCGDTKMNFIASVNEKYISTWRQTVALSDTRPDPYVKIEDHDMNTWGIASVGNGFDSIFNDVSGYALYKTSVDITGNESTLVFKEVTGNEVEIHINGEEKFSGDCQWGRKITIPIDNCGKCEIAVIIHSSSNSDNGGISKPVVIV
ncbi:MAG: DUF4982 domain-containing protein [Oscillospiraceae bacterium]|nr:DUF4982 domain-containing protein [Oscillospiraceae bacterium]